MEKSEDGAVRRDRRRFAVEMAMALLGGAAITVGCGGGGGGGNPAAPGAPATPTPPRATPTPPPAGLRFGTISDNHGHEVVITDAELQPGDALRLTLGGAMHDHRVDLTADEVVQIRGGARVVKISSEDVGLLGPHAHSVTFN